MYSYLFFMIIRNTFFKKNDLQENFYANTVPYPCIRLGYEVWELGPSNFYKGEKFEFKFKKQDTWGYVFVKIQKMYT